MVVEADEIFDCAELFTTGLFKGLDFFSSGIAITLDLF
jgi:hypothetical protein